MSQIVETASSSSIQADYMRLLVSQLQNQNPLEPLSNNEMASQLAQFSQLQQIESMNSNFAKVLTGIERTYANSLIGKEVSYVGETSSGSEGLVTGKVERVYNNVDGQILLGLGDHAISLEDVVSVRD